MALVRVYCGLASAPPAAAARSSASVWLTAAVVDDAGRLLDVCDISDDAVGYAELGALLSERSGGTAGVAVAADCGEHQITLLLAAAGRPLSIADEESLDDYANRFGDDDSPDEIQAASNVRRAVGLSRALQAGALAASVQGAPRELMALKPVLAAHAALATGRQGAAVALREVLRELYPAALRAYPDPAEPIPLAILDALPEPGLLGTGGANRDRDAEVATQLVEAGVADLETITEAITSLRLAIAETPRRAGIGKTLTTAVAETIRQSVAAVRACDRGITALVGLLAEKATPVPTLARSFPSRQRPAQPQGAPLRAIREEAAPAPLIDPVHIPTGSHQRYEPAAPDYGYPASPAAMAPMPAPRPAPIPAPRPATDPLPSRPSERSRPAAADPLPSRPSERSRPAAADPLPSRPSERSRPAAADPLPSRPSERSRPAAADPLPSRASERPREAAELPRQPEPRLATGVPAPGSRADWPLNTSASGLSDQAVGPNTGGYPPVRPGDAEPLPRQRDGRVKPPWQADDLPSEPPSLRLVEAEPIREPRFDQELLRDPWSTSDPDRDSYSGGPSLRLVEPAWAGGTDALDAPLAPAGDDGDDSLLIFAQASAWFTGQTGEHPPINWSSPTDQGWQAAERATSPIIEDETAAGLPRRVPQANLVPGSAFPPAQRPLRIVRDAEALAQHTTGYFRGSRRGEEVRGFAVGGRPGRESAGGWDFSRDGWETEQDTDHGYEYRSAARH